jgi:hypothetical protein
MGKKVRRFRPGGFDVRRKGRFDVRRSTFDGEKFDGGRGRRNVECQMEGRLRLRFRLSGGRSGTLRAIKN